MKLHLEEKVVLITGAAGTIGSAVARAFAAEGAAVALLDTNASGLDALAFDLHTIVKVRRCTVDLTQPEEAQTMIAEVLQPFAGRVDILVNCAGICPAFAPEYLLTTQALPVWQQLYDANFLSTLHAIVSVWPRMKEQGGGVILNTTSDLAREPVLEMLPYSIAKAALVHLTYGLAPFLGQANIRLVAVAPGPTRTAIWTQKGGLIDFYATQHDLPPEEALVHEFQRRGMAIPRLIEPKEVAALMVYLASDHARAMTRTVVDLNGGSHHGQC
ncbi:SDR family NAD(P)-dependent oxidoreductase [Dictyobacter arantiisoli]|uniref:Putative oxidoreductase YvrD n=1 Tax=Dictyobacter arantiisoli TaxID=2014874 RepID=A0A5A5TJN8_9CHLR|nr:SDR family oxidoreductase [Dictyobacter arantiisoli]GCF11239.1 putative oxidoreductase YvrD [Dictyobacter arantiisoli]